jgi:hypothetical protein
MSTPRTSVLTPICTAALFLAACGNSDAAQEQCATELVTGTTFTVPQTAGDRSFQAHTTFDGNAIWMTHASAIAADESIVVKALRIQCDGTISSEEVGVEAQEGLQTEPRITSHGGKVMIAWQHDDQVSSTNLSTYYKIFDREEDPATSPAIRLETQYAGVAAGNTWMPELDASASGFVLAGLRGVNEYASFQAFAQRIDFDGATVGGAINAQLSDELVQNMVSASLADDGSVVMSWTRESDNELEHAVHVAVESDSDAPANEPIRVCTNECSMVSLGGNEHRGQYVAAVAPDGTIALKPSTLFNAEAPLLTVGTPGDTPMFPTIAVGPESGAVAWLSQLSGFNAEIHLQAFTGDGYDISLVGSEAVVPTDNPAIGPYRLSLIHVQDAVYMLTWTEGPTSALQVKWRFVDLAQ